MPLIKNQFNKTFKVGMIGIGSHSQENLIPSLKLIDNCELYVITARNMVVLEKCAKNLNVPYFTNNWREIVDCEEVDAVMVSGPPELHEEVLEYGILCKKPIFTEKPPASNLSNLTSLVMKAESQKSPTFVGYNFRFADTVSKLELSSEKTKHIQMTIHANKPQEIMWNCNSVLESYLYAVGIHSIEFVSNYSGELRKVESCVRWLNANHFIINVTIDFNRGPSAHLIMSNTTPSFQTEINIWNHLGQQTVVTNLRDRKDFEVASGKKLSKLETPSGLKGGFRTNGYQNEIEAFINEINGFQEASSPLRNSLKVYQIIQSILSSVRGVQ